MNDLLDLAIAAHGGWDHWQHLSKLTASASVSGVLWALKGNEGIMDNVSFEVDCHRHHVVYPPLNSPERRSVYTPSWTTIETVDGKIVESRDNPRFAFEGHSVETKWDKLHLVYFSGYAIWTNLTSPLLLKLPNVRSEEIEPWDEQGQVWRRLKVTFPPENATHSTEQVFYFGKEGLLRRQDYNVDVLVGVPSVNYASEQKEFSGLVIPTRRRVYWRGPDGQPIRDNVIVSIDFNEIKVNWSRQFNLIQGYL
jgi:hypothetical protein